MMTIAQAAESPVTLSRAALADAAPAPAVVHPMVDTRLEVGDLVSVPAGVRYMLRNTGLTPATFLALAIQTGHEGRGSEGGETAAFPFAVAQGIAVKDLAGDSLAVAIGPLDPAAIALGRVTLPPGAAFPSHRVPGAELYAVATGNVQLTLASGFAVARRASGTVQSLAADSGPPAVLGAGDGALVEAGATSTLANTDGEPATLLVVTLRPGSYDPLPRQHPR